MSVIPALGPGYVYEEEDPWDSLIEARLNEKLSQKYKKEEEGEGREEEEEEDEKDWGKPPGINL